MVEKKNLHCSVEDKKKLIEPLTNEISINRQCDLLGLNRSTYYYQSVAVDTETLELLRLVDKVYTDHPTFGTRTMSYYLRNEYNKIVLRDRMRTIYKMLQIRAIYQEPKTTVSNPEHKKYPYLLRNTPITHINQVWSTDITYIRLEKGFVYLSAIIDWFSRYVLGWSLDISMEAYHCVDLLQDTINKYGTCEIFNTDQGSQYTSTIFTECVLNNNMKISMDGCGRWADNIWVERLWRSVKYECIYLNDFAQIIECTKALTQYFYFYNHKRPHHSLGGIPPAQIYYGKM